MTWRAVTRYVFGALRHLFHCLLHPEEAEWRNVSVLNENIISCWCCISLLNLKLFDKRNKKCYLALINALGESFGIIIRYNLLLCAPESNIINEPQHDKTNKMACAPSKDSDQSAQSCSLIRFFAVRKKKHWVLGYFRAHNEASGQMPRLIWVFAGRTSFCWFCHVVSHLSVFKKLLRESIRTTTLVLQFVQIIIIFESQQNRIELKEMRRTSHKHKS